MQPSVRPYGLYLHENARTASSGDVLLDQMLGSDAQLFLRIVGYRPNLSKYHRTITGCDQGTKGLKFTAHCLPDIASVLLSVRLLNFVWNTSPVV